jgi:hypothetical protein
LLFSCILVAANSGGETLMGLKVRSGGFISRACKGSQFGRRNSNNGISRFHLMPLDVVENYFHESVIFFFKFLKSLLHYDV